MGRRKPGAAQNRGCLSCNKTFSKAEHLTRHLRSHTKERPYECSVCGKLYTRSDVLRRHEKSHQKSSSPLSPDQRGPGTAMFSPLSPNLLNPPPLSPECPSTMPAASDRRFGIDELQPIDSQPALGMGTADPDSWFLGAGLDLNALDLSLSSAVMEWAQLPPQLPVPSSGDVSTHCQPPPIPSGAIPTAAPEQPAERVRQRWFTRLTVEEGARISQASSTHHGGSFGQGNIAADEQYRAGLSQTLQPRINDESLPSADQLNLFANLFFSRFNSLLPIVHLPSFKPTMENSLLFVSICSIGSLFVGSASAAAQGTRLFERLNKAILASWESILSRSRSNALSMVQAAVLGQTFAILSGRPKALVLADVLHGTVMAWARESNRNAQQVLHDPPSPDTSGCNLEEQWMQWIDQEQRRRVEIALDIHDAELASLLHHDPLRKHRLSQYHRGISDALFAAPTASRWAELFQTTAAQSLTFDISDDPLQATVPCSKFSAYGVLDSINAHVIEARRSNTLDKHESRHLSNTLMRWWRIYTTHFSLDAEEDPFNLTVLWHLVFMGIYADIDLLEQASGREGANSASTSAPLVRSWATSQDASRCLVHALLMQRYLERMRVSSEPAIHVPRALFTAALAWFCFTHVGGGHTIDASAFDAPEIKLVGGFTNPHDLQRQLLGDATFSNVSHLHRLTDLLTRFGRWGISQAFSTALCAALESE
ncbi:hypothetical protein RU639_004513 [Aspergillus parasiticus]